jgi:aminoglycoside phosphotransferase (APT) family kinase protein
VLYSYLEGELVSEGGVSEDLKAHLAMDSVLAQLRATPPTPHVGLRSPGESTGAGSSFDACWRNRVVNILNNSENSVSTGLTLRLWRPSFVFNDYSIS